MMCRWADKARETIRERPRSYRDAWVLHEECSRLIERLRSGSRRHAFGDVRADLRACRERLAKRWFRLPTPSAGKGE
jgi:hypothetical protein